MESHSTKRGRPSTDIAANIRNRLWASEVYRRAGCSWDELDFRFIPTASGPKAPRSRAFWSMAHAGIDPRSKPRLQSGVDLVEVTDGCPELTGTKALYESKLWKLLDKSLTRSERREIFRALIQSLGLFRADWLVRPMGHWILPDEPAFRSRDDDATKHVIQYLANTPSLDGIALLGCAYKEAIDRLDLVEANSYLKGMRSLFVVIAKPFPANVKTWIGDLQAIVEKRVCRNDWTALYASSARVASLSLPVRSAVFLAPGPNAMGRYHRHPMSRDEMLDLADLGTLDAFIGLLALAREGELINDDQRHSVPSIFAFGIFAKILRSHPHLEVAWEKLYDSLVFAFWSRWYGEGISPGFKKQYIVTHRADLAIDESALCMIGGGRKITLAREV